MKETPVARRHEFGLERIYGNSASIGYRVLVDRLWPRGVSKKDAALDEWLKDVAPTTDLRKWYNHDVPRFDEFADRYRSELGEPPASIAVDHLLEVVRSKRVILLTATRDVPHSGGKVLLDYLNDKH
ncbi:MAG: DUF488 family protein [Armatimonadetes bacterium]|nr:MAG: DUF488 family protein [Armatimonadota bacterium]